MNDSGWRPVAGAVQVRSAEARRFFLGLAGTARRSVEPGRDRRFACAGGRRGKAGHRRHRPDAVRKAREVIVTAVALLIVMIAGTRGGMRRAVSVMMVMLVDRYGCAGMRGIMGAPGRRWPGEEQSGER